MNAGHDESMLDAVAVYALGALPDAEAREVAAHIADCAECAREYSELRGVANLAGYGAETAENQPTQLQSARMKNAILREIRGESPKSSATAPAAAAAPAAMLARPRAPWLAYLAAAACLAVAFLSDVPVEQTILARALQLSLLVLGRLGAVAGQICDAAQLAISRAHSAQSAMWAATSRAWQSPSA